MEYLCEAQQSMIRREKFPPKIKMFNLYVHYTHSKIGQLFFCPTLSYLKLVPAVEVFYVGLVTNGLSTIYYLFLNHDKSVVRNLEGFLPWLIGTTWSVLQ